MSVRSRLYKHHSFIYSLNDCWSRLSVGQALCWILVFKKQCVWRTVNSEKGKHKLKTCKISVLLYDTVSKQQTGTRHHYACKHCLLLQNPPFQFPFQKKVFHYNNPSEIKYFVWNIWRVEKFIMNKEYVQTNIFIPLFWFTLSCILITHLFPFTLFLVFIHPALGFMEQWWWGIGGKEQRSCCEYIMRMNRVSFLLIECRDVIHRNQGSRNLRTLA